MQISGLSASNTFSATDVLAIEVNENGTNKTYKLTGATLATALASIGSYLKTTDVVNKLTSTNTDKPLSAAQGKALNDKTVNLDDLGSFASESALVTALNTKTATMNNNTTCVLRFSMSSATSNFSNASYAGTITRGSNAPYCNMLVSRNGSGSYAEALTGSCSNGQWVFEKLALNSNLTTLNDKINQIKSVLLNNNGSTSVNAASGGFFALWFTNTGHLVRINALGVASAIIGDTAGMNISASNNIVTLTNTAGYGVRLIILG